MAAPESRIAVLLFTDIVGSTELKSQHGVPAFREALQTHNEHFERVARECRGVEILQNMGDGYLARADSVAEAVKAALLFQDAMREGPWGAVRLTSRVGIHAGETSSLPAVARGVIMGPAVDLASRVMSLADGGQILMTRQPFDESRHFLREHPAVDGKTLPPLRWMAHGFYRLKGVNEPTEIFEVGLEGGAPFAPPRDGPKGERVRAANAPRPRRAGRDFCLGMLAVALAFALKLTFERTESGARFDRWLAFRLQLLLGTQSAPRTEELLLVDISGIPPESVNYPPFPGETNPRKATPRAPLAEFIETIATMKPRSIAVDIDFSAWEDGRAVTPEDPAFFETVLQSSKSHGVPIFLGVSRQQWSEPALWLGAERFRPLAASVKVPMEPETRDYYVRWQSGPGGAPALPTLGLALAGREGEAGQLGSGGGSNWAVQATQLRSTVSGEGPAGSEMSWARIDYSQLRSLEKEFLSVIHVGTLNDNRQKIPGRMVLIGDFSEPEHHDHFNIGDLHSLPVPGVYLHACAALTAQGPPLFELTGRGRLAIYLPVALVFLAALVVFRARSGGWRMALAAVTAAIAPWLMAMGFVGGARILWTDFVALSFGLLFWLSGAPGGDRSSTN